MRLAVLADFVKGVRQAISFNVDIPAWFFAFLFSRQADFHGQVKHIDPFPGQRGHQGMKMVDIFPL